MAIETNILLQSGTNELEVIEFILSYKERDGEIRQQNFGLNVTKVREIIRMPELTLVPNLTHGVSGIFNLRNRIIPVIDLGLVLYNLKNERSSRKLIITEFNKMWSGFIVDNVHRIHRISWNQIVSPETLQDINQEHSSITGLIKFDDRNVLMLDVEKIVADINPHMAIEEISGQKSAYEVKPIAVTAEDSQTIRKMITDRLKSAGFEIYAFNDGKEAWDYLQQLVEKARNGNNIKNLVDIIITDIEMPRMDGYTLTKSIKTDEVLKNVPVVLFSSMINRDILHKGESVGADAQLSKPQIGDLLEVVRNLLSS
ncbi:MAG: chemotaxis protein [Candidatus Kapaibacterium sp.]